MHAKIEGGAIGSNMQGRPSPLNTRRQPSPNLDALSFPSSASLHVLSYFLPFPLFPSIPCLSVLSCAFFSFPLFLLLEEGPLKSSERVWGRAISSPAGSGAEPQPKSNLVDFNL